MNRCSIVLFNIVKKRNFGTILRTADALGVSEIVVVGRKRFTMYGNFRAHEPGNQRHFFALPDAADYLKAQGFEIMGVEISEGSLPVESHPFQGDTAFLMGNEGTGLTDGQKAFCDRLIYIKQYGRGASLNVNVAAGIVLHHFALWAEFPSNQIIDQKFIKD